MLHPSTQKLIDRLAEMTATKKIDWTEYQSGGVNYSTEGYSVVLTAAPVELIIFSDAEKELERATVDQLMATPASEGGTYSDLVTTMHAEALRFARGTETAISTLLNQLETPVEESAAIEADPEPVALSEDSSAPFLEDETDDTILLQSEAFADIAESSSESDADVAADTDSMTAAVARLADEVKEREDETAAEATQSPIEVAPEAAEITEEAKTETDTDTEEEATTSGEADIAASPSEDAPEFAYIPFGLTSEAELPEEPSSAAADNDLEDIDSEDDMPEPRAVFTPTVISPIANDDEPQSQLEDAPTDLAGITASALDQADTTLSGDSNSSPTTTGFAGIGAGTGLLRTPVADDEVESSEAPETPPEAPSDSGRFVIDATDDVVDFDPSELADEMTSAESSDADQIVKSSPAETADAQADEEDETTAEPERPRFNPWN